MNKSIRKSLCLCAAALMIGGAVAPSASNNVSASAHSRYTVNRYSHKRNIHKYNTKRIAHLQSVHKYHLRIETKDERNLASHRKSLAHYNHLIRVHKHNRKMINNLTRAKNKLIKMIKSDQYGITRQARLVESEEHQINLIKHAKPSNKTNNGKYGGKGYYYWFNDGKQIYKEWKGNIPPMYVPNINSYEERAIDAGIKAARSSANYGGKRYSYWFNLGKRSHHARGPRGMNHWESRAFITGYNSVHHPKSAANYAKMNRAELSSAWSEIGYDVGHGSTYPNNYAQDEAGNSYNLSLVDIDSMSLANKLSPRNYDAKAFAKGLMNGRNQLYNSEISENEDNTPMSSIASSAYPSSATPSATSSFVMSAAPSASDNY